MTVMHKLINIINKKNAFSRDERYVRNLIFSEKSSEMFFTGMPETKFFEEVILFHKEFHRSRLSALIRKGGIP